MNNLEFDPEISIGGGKGLFEFLKNSTIVLFGKPGENISREKYIEKYFKGYNAFSGWHQPAKDSFLSGNNSLLYIITDNPKASGVLALQSRFGNKVVVYTYTSVFRNVESSSLAKDYLEQYCKEYDKEATIVENDKIVRAYLGGSKSPLYAVSPDSDKFWCFVKFLIRKEAPERVSYRIGVDASNGDSFISIERFVDVGNKSFEKFSEELNKGCEVLYEWLVEKTPRLYKMIDESL